MSKAGVNHKPQRGDKNKQQMEEKSSHTILLTLEDNKRYAHTATCQYRISMASLQPDERRLPHCVCNSINEERRQRTKSEDKVVLVVEHDLNEYVLCVLEPNKVNHCKLNLEIQPGEQIAFRTIGKTPVLLTGLSCEPVS